MHCFYCEEPATNECPTCGRLYCDDHGEDACLRCLAPESATPSVWAYRGSLIALVAGVAVTAYLLISPPQTRSDSLPVQPLATRTPITIASPTPVPPTPTTSGGTATARPPGSPTVTTTAAAGTATPTPATGPTSTPTASPAGRRTYTIAPGDTLSAIAARFGTTVDAIVALNPGITPDSLQPGQVITIAGAQ
jgi:LysM repeat protein